MQACEPCDLCDSQVDTWMLPSRVWLCKPCLSETGLIQNP